MVTLPTYLPQSVVIMNTLVGSLVSDAHGHSTYVPSTICCDNEYTSWFSSE